MIALSKVAVVAVVMLWLEAARPTNTRHPSPLLDEDIVKNNCQRLRKKCS